MGFSAMRDVGVYVKLPGPMTPNLPESVPLRSGHLYATSLASIALCITLWIRAKTVDQEERGNAERRALFVGLWPPMFWLIGDTMQLDERASSSRLRRPVRSG
jgi:hypothetical protein